MHTLVSPVETSLPIEQALETYSATFREQALGGDGTWSRVARSLLLMAVRAGITLDEDTLILSDVRELQALQHRMAEAAEA